MATATRAAIISPTEVLGKRLLSEVSTTEETLESLLASLRTAAHPNPSPSGIPALDTLWSSSSTSKATTANPTTNSTNKTDAPSLRRLTLSHRGLPLLYHIITTLLSSHNATVCILDLDRRFSPSHLLSSSLSSPSTLTPKDIQHIHIFRPLPSNLAATVASLEDYMLYGEHRSHGREWKGVFISGSMAGLGEALKMLGRDVVVVQASRRGWMRVERRETGLFVEGMAVEEAWGEREQREKAVEGKGWVGTCEGGEFRWD